uniref:NADH-ubiquinone oxidoreductase chain 2 n=1 Tax=Dendrothrips minowai TaxID=1030662 RepID=A0A343WRN8_9NEOP|nr:NADH dehydrogenase subunit 2 [Dendrothrips minowai]AWD37107.1 NADH dehydrogenase subunit 2 [Dendrothrips minowai]
MKNLFLSNNLILFTFLMSSILLSISSDSFISLWISLEINLSSIIPIFMKNEMKKTEKSIIMYFLIQSISSTLVLMSFIMLMYPFVKKMSTILLMMSVFLKLGISPLHFWVPAVMESLNWISCALLSTVQKVIPLIILSMIKEKIMILFCLFNSLISSVSGMNQFSMRKVMSFSSLNHLSFILMSILISKKFLKFFFVIYLFATFFTFNIFYKKTLTILYTYFFFNKYNKTNFFFLMILILSFAGIPPFLGFFPKLFVMIKMVEMNSFYHQLCLLILSIVTTFFYSRMCFSSFLVQLNKNKMKSKKVEKNQIKQYFFFINSIFILF